MSNENQKKSKKSVKRDTNLTRRLIMGRKRAGLSMDALANSIEKSKAAIHKYEQGLMTPTSDVLIKMAKVFRVNINYFFKGYHHLSLKPFGVNYFKLDTISEDIFDTAMIETVNYIERYLELEYIAGVKSKLTQPVNDLVVTEEDAVRVAKMVRKKWKLGTNPIYSISELLEEKGIKISYVHTHKDLRGLSFYLGEGEVPVIIINLNRVKPTECRMVLLHELGHLILNTEFPNQSEELEKICDIFAAEMLFPRDAMLVEMGSDRSYVSYTELEDFGEKYGMDIDDIITNASRANVLDEDAIEKLKGFTKKDQTELYKGTERSRSFRRLLLKTLNQGKISVPKAASLMDMTVDKFKKEFKDDIAHLFN